jgi:hypothetical protein
MKFVICYWLLVGLDQCGGKVNFESVVSEGFYEKIKNLSPLNFQL